MIAALPLALFVSAPPDWPAAVEAALERAGDNRAEIEAALTGADPRHEAGLLFLVEHMPEPDLRTLDAAFLLENAALAYAARDAAPWELDDALFLDYVLPYAQVNETRERWRPDFAERFRERVAECETPGEAAQVLNRTLFGELGVRYSTGRRRPDQSPSESIEIGMASCTGLSILLADACRAVGVPARLAGTPNWADKRGNHTWVEVWDDGWHFVGAAEPSDEGLDHGWFAGDAARAVPGSREHGIFATSWRRTGASFPMVWARDVDWVPAVDVTDRYVPAERRAASPKLYVDVVDGADRRVAARVELVDAGLAGTSSDESRDTNDALTFAPAPGVYTVRASLDGRSAEERVELGAESVRVRLVLSPADGLDAALRARFADGTPVPERFDALLVADPAAVRARAWEAYRAAPEHAALRADVEADRVREGGHESPYTLREVGERPADGWGLVIAMHGGGGVPKEVNDSQWRVMQRYYRDQEPGGYLYLALRAPTDEWNGFYTGYAYPLVATLIRQLVLFREVDPDRVYLIGYSHGGYGAFAIGPQMPDRFAAIHSSAAAPTDGQTSALNLRNTRMTYMIGERDNAYGRLERCRRFDETIAGLRGERDDVFPVELLYREGHGHGGLPDRDHLASMLPHRRDPLPRELSWEPLGGAVRDHFWLSLEGPATGQRVDARLEGNRVELDGANVERVTLWLDERLVDLAQPLVVGVGERVVERALRPRLETLCESLERRGDPRLAFGVRIDVGLAR